MRLVKSLGYGLVFTLWSVVVFLWGDDALDFLSELPEGVFGFGWTIFVFVVCFLCGYFLIFKPRK